MTKQIDKVVVAVTRQQRISLMEAVQGVLKDLWDLQQDDANIKEIGYWQRLYDTLAKAKS